MIKNFKSFLFNYNKIVKKCILGCTILIFSCYKNVGALTSKPFAFRARSWELETSYIVNLSDGLADKIRVDVKGLEVVRILPWLNNKNTEGWISDKTRFSYDGLSINRVDKFYFKKYLVLIPLILNIFFSSNSLYKKYLLIFLKKNNKLKKFWFFWTSKNAFYEYLFSLFSYSSLFSNLFFFYDLKIILKKNLDLKISKFINSNLNLHTFLLNFSTLSVKKNIIFLKFFFKKIKEKFKLNSLFSLKNFFLTVKNFWFENMYFNIFLPLFNLNKGKKYNFFSLNEVDLLSSKYLEDNKLINLVYSNKLNCILWNFSFFHFFHEKNEFLNFDLIFMLGSNIWLNAPRLHILIWKLIKVKKIDIISFANNDFFLFQTLNLGFEIKILKKIMFGKHWMNSLLIKNRKIIFVVGAEFFFNKSILTLFKNFKKLNNFFFNLNFAKLHISNNFYKKIYKNYFFTNYFTFTLLLDHAFKYNNFFFSKKNSNFIKKIRTFNFFQKKIENNSLNFFLNFKDLKKYEFFLFNFFKIKNSFNTLITSTIVELNINKNIDFVVPISNNIENFNIYKTHQGFINKSLFIKFGPWLSRSLLIYLSLLSSIKIYPYFWLLNFNKFNNQIIYLNISIWLQGLSKNFKNRNFKKISLVPNFNLNEKIKRKLYFSFNINLITQTNFWFSDLNFIKVSKYSNLGLNLSKKINKTFQML